MLVSAMFTPHPPLIIPEIGGENIKEVEKTVSAMKEIGRRIVETDPETIVVISPHGLIHQSEMLIGASPKMAGSFENFDHPETFFSFKGDPSLADKIQKSSVKENIPASIIDHNSGNYFLDHGVLVPIYYLTEELGSDVMIVPISYSMLSRAEHYSFGQIVGQVIDKSSERIAVVASGDLSHRLFEKKAGKIGSQFDRFLVENIQNYNPGKIINVDEESQDIAHECGYRSLLILLGVLDGKKIKTEVLSYEGPFGVGYMVADFKINS